MNANHQISDMMIGVRNMIEAADLRHGDQVLLLADTRSDKATLEALTAGLRFFGAEPMTLVTEPIARYGAVPQAVLKPCMHRMSSFGCGRCLSRSRRRIAPWAAREKKVAANYTKSA